MGYVDSHSSFVIGYFTDDLNKWFEKKLESFGISIQDLPRFYGGAMVKSLQWMYRKVYLNDKRIIKEIIAKVNEHKITGEPFTVNLADFEIRRKK